MFGAENMGFQVLTDNIESNRGDRCSLPLVVDLFPRFCMSRFSCYGIVIVNDVDECV